MLRRLAQYLVVMGLLAIPGLARAQEDIELPAAPDSIARAGNAIVLMLPASGGYEINHQKVAIEDISQQLRAIYGARPNKILLVTWSANRPWKEVATVVLLAHEEGITCYRITGS